MERILWGGQDSREPSREGCHRVGSGMCASRILTHSFIMCLLILLGRALAEELEMKQGLRQKSLLSRLSINTSVSTIKAILDTEKCYDENKVSWLPFWSHSVLPSTSCSSCRVPWPSFCPSDRRATHISSLCCPHCL